MKGNRITNEIEMEDQETSISKIFFPLVSNGWEKKTKSVLIRGSS